MKSIHIILTIILTILSCSKDSDKGTMELNPIYLENKDLFKTVTCFSITNIHAQSGFVIGNESTYQKYADSMRIHPLNSNCDTATLKDIGFGKYTLIGILTAHGSCDSLSKEILMDNRNDKIIYTIDIGESLGPCIEILYIPLNLALISKIPEHYQVEFEVKRHPQ